MTINYLTRVNQSLLACAKADLKIDIWDFDLNVKVMTLVGHTSLINVLKMVQSNILASGSSDSTMKLWDLSSGTLIKNLTGHLGQIRNSLDLLTENMLISGSYDSKIKIWNLTTRLVEEQICASFQISSLALIEDTNGNLILYRI